MKSKVRIKVAGGVFRAFFTRIQAPLQATHTVFTRTIHDLHQASLIPGIGHVELES